MPSPFPGMDPWLEHPAFFPDLHDRMIIHLSEAVQASLPEPYFAAVSDRLWVEISDRPIEPDVNIIRAGEQSGERHDNGGVAVIAGAQPVIVTIPHDEHREPFFEIRARIEGGERIVTTVEILSLSNKSRGSEGRKLYLQKQQEILDGEVHLVEIDLLRGGEHTTAVPRNLVLAKAGAFDYHVCVHRFNRFADYFVYPIRVRDRLPPVGIPLLPGDPDVVLDLQPVFDRCYDAGPYSRRVRYEEIQPVPPLAPEDAAWASALLKVGSQQA